MAIFRASYFEECQLCGDHGIIVIALKHSEVKINVASKAGGYVVLRFFVEEGVIARDEADVVMAQIEASRLQEEASPMDIVGLSAFIRTFDDEFDADHWRKVSKAPFN